MSDHDDRVEHTLEVAVPVERAWRAFTTRRERSRGEAPEYAIDPRPGGKVRWRIPPTDPVDGEVVAVDPRLRGGPYAPTRGDGGVIAPP